MKASVKSKITNIIKKGDVVFVGVGNSIRGDDGVGPYVVSCILHCHSEPPTTIVVGGEESKKRDSSSPCLRQGLLRMTHKNKSYFIDAGEMPENYIKTIAGFNPKRVALIDAMDFLAKPGEIEIFQIDKIKDTTASTHNMSLGLFSEHIKQLTNSQVLLIGIQPHSVKLGEGLSDAVRQTADELIALLK